MQQRWELFLQTLHLSCKNKMAPDVSLKQTLDRTFWIPTWLEDDLRSFEYFRKTALTLFLWIARRGWCSLSSSLLIPRILKNKVNHSSKRGPPPFIYSDTNPVLGNVLVHSVKIKKHSGCNSAISLVLVLEDTLFQLCSKWSHSFILLLPNDIFLLHLQKLILLSTTIARMLLASRLVSRWKDVK